MNKIIEDWLDEPNGLTRSPGGVSYLTLHPSNKEVLAELIYKNGGRWDLNDGFGNSVEGVGPYGYMGLNIPDALLLIGMHGLVEGMLKMCGENQDEIILAIQGEITRVEGECLKLFPEDQIQPIDNGLLVGNLLPDFKNGGS